MAKFYVRHLNHQARTVQVIKTKRPKKSHGGSALAKGRNRARIMNRKIENLLKQPAFAPHREELKGYIKDKYKVNSVLYNKNGKLTQFHNHKQDEYVTGSDFKRFNRYYNKVMKGEYSPNRKQDFYVRGVLNKKGLANKKYNLKQFKMNTNGKVKLSASQRLRFGISATEYDSEQLAHKYGMSYSQLQDLGRKGRNGEVEDLTEDQKRLGTAFETGEGDEQMDEIRRAREDAVLYNQNGNNGKD